MEKDARNNTAGGRSSRPMIAGGVAAIAVGSALLWASETAGGLPDAVAWGVWGAGVAMIAVGSLRNRKELKVAAESAEQTAPSPEGPRNPAPQAGAETGMRSVEALVQRSDDVAATLRDLVSHGQASADYGMLPALLVRSGLMDWEGAPRFSANRLRRNRRWWMSCDVDELTEDGYNRLIALEGALNLAADLAEGACPDAPDDQGRIKALFRDLASLSPLPAPEGRTFPAGEKDGEWATRLALSEWLENLPAPSAWSPPSSSTSTRAWRASTSPCPVPPAWPSWRLTTRPARRRRRAATPGALRSWWRAEPSRPRRVSSAWA